MFPNIRRFGHNDDLGHYTFRPWIDLAPRSSCSLRVDRDWSRCLIFLGHPIIHPTCIITPNRNIVFLPTTSANWPNMAEPTILPTRTRDLESCRLEFLSHTKSHWKNTVSYKQAQQSINIVKHSINMINNNEIRMYLYVTQIYHK